MDTFSSIDANKIVPTSTPGDPTPPGSEVAWTPVQDPISHEFLDINGPVPYMTQDLTVDMRMAVWAEHYED